MRKEKCFLRKAPDFPKKDRLTCESKSYKKERTKMSNNNNQLNIPQAKEAMNKFKMQAASEEDVSSTS